ncbi:MAG: hypothetical protein ACJ79K_05925 [Gemmatimonadaceae bacterium]
MKYFPALCACLVAFAGGLGAQASTPQRFKDPEHTTADPTGLRPDRRVSVAPVYPAHLESEKVIGAPIVAFVIDTTGRVEIETASFVSIARPEFAKAVCDNLRTLRYEPFLLGDQKWRVLLVKMFGFEMLVVPDTTTLRAASALAQRTQEEFATKPIAGVIAHLESLPHCDSPAIK